MAVAGAVLTGGASRRMGRDKATLEIDGVAMAARVVGALEAGGCAPVFLVGGDAARLAGIGRPVVADAWPGEGPLGAVIVALRHAAQPVLVAACDLPWLDAGTVGSLLAAHLAHPDVDVVHAASPAIEPLCAVWHPSALASLTSAFAAGERGMQRAIAGLRAHPCAVDPLALANINRPGDLPEPLG